jgi:hypothetical protein
MLAHFGPVVLGLLVIAAMLVLRVRSIGRGGKLPLIDRPSPSDRRRIQIYVTAIGVLAMAVVVGVAIWSFNADG